MQQIHSPYHKICNSRTCWLATSPQLQVLDTIVRLEAVPMMNILVQRQVSAEMLLHHQDMLKNVCCSFRGPRVPWGLHHDVPLLVIRPTSLPSIAARPCRAASLAHTMDRVLADWCGMAHHTQDPWDTPGLALRTFPMPAARVERRMTLNTLPRFHPATLAEVWTCCK